MTPTLQEPSTSLLPQWVKESLAKQLKAQCPAAGEERISAALEQAAGLMGPVFCLATLHATATVILRHDSPGGKRPASPAEPRFG